MRREVRIIFISLAVPVIIWSLVSLYYVARSFTNLGFRIAQKQEVQVTTRFVGVIFYNAFPDEMAKAGNSPLTWNSANYSVQIDPDTKIMTLKSQRFVKDAQLKYDGWRWQGFANIPTRVSPIQVDVW